MLLLALLVLVSASFTASIAELNVSKTIGISPTLTEVKDLDYFDGSVYVVNNKDGKVHVFGKQSYSITGINLNITHVLVGSINNRTYIIYTTPGRIVRNNPVRKEAPSIGEVGSMELLGESIFIGDAYGKVKRFSKDLELEKVVAKFGERWQYIDSAVYGDKLLFLQDVNGSKVLKFFDVELNLLAECEVSGTQVATLGDYILVLGDKLYVLDESCSVMGEVETNATHIEGDGDFLALLEGSEVKVVDSITIKEVEETPAKNVTEEREERPPAEETNESRPMNVSEEPGKELQEVPVNVEEKEQRDYTPFIYLLVGVAAILLLAVLWVATHGQSTHPKGKPKYKHRKKKR